MRSLTAIALILTACGGSASTSTPEIPFLAPATSAPIAILEPLDTSTGDHMPSNIYDAAEVVAGTVPFAWQPVNTADRYVLLLQDVGNPAGAQAGESYTFETYAQFTVMDSETRVLLGLKPGGVRRTLVMQVFAYAGREIVGQSEAWTLAVVPIIE